MFIKGVLITRHCSRGCYVPIPDDATSCPNCGAPTYTYTHNGGALTYTNAHNGGANFKNVPEIDLLEQKQHSEKEARLEMAQMKKLHDKLLELYYDGLECDDIKCDECLYKGMACCVNHKAIDHMISHGVTIDQKKQIYGRSAKEPVARL